MNELRKTGRDVKTGLRKVGRELDGHTLSDDIGNAGDDLRKHAGNLRDDARDRVDDAGDTVHELIHDRDRDRDARSAVDDH